MEPWINLICNCGVSAVLAWYLYYTQTTAFPRAQQAHEEALGKIVDRFTQELAAERTAREPMQRLLSKLVTALRRRPCLLQTEAVPHDRQPA